MAKIKKAQLGNLIKGVVKGVAKGAEKSFTKATVKTLRQQDAKKALQKAIEKRTSPKAKPSYLDEFDMPESKSRGSVISKKLESKNKVNKPYKSGGTVAKDGKWMQKVTKSIKARGTEGVCTGKKFGGPTCKPGSKRYNLAKTFKSIAKKKK